MSINGFDLETEEIPLAPNVLPDRAPTNNVVLLRDRLKDDPFSELLAEGMIESYCARGIGHELLPFEIPVVRRGIDKEVWPCHPVDPSLDDIEAITDLEERAHVLQRINLRSTCPRTEALIRSVADAGWIGSILQGNLVPPEPVRKFWPYWYRPPQPRRKPIFETNLFEAFAEDFAALETADDTHKA